MTFMAAFSELLFGGSLTFSGCFSSTCKSPNVCANVMVDIARSLFSFCFDIVLLLPSLVSRFALTNVVSNGFGKCLSHAPVGCKRSLPRRDLEAVFKFAACAASPMAWNLQGNAWTTACHRRGRWDTPPQIPSCRGGLP